MDFIERILGISPDAGSGATELLIVIVMVAIAGLVTMRRAGRIASARSRRDD